MEKENNRTEPQRIIAISREYGSGGHEIAERIAKAMHMAFYDRNLLDEIAKEKLVDATAWEKFDEAPKNRVFHRTVRGYCSSPEENLARLQFDFIKRKAESGESFVIVGRCAEYVLEDYENLISIFVLGEYGHKLERIMQRYHLNEKEAKEKIARHDRKRKQYHNHYCPIKWGDSRNYDVCINSSTLGIDETVNLLEKFIKTVYKE